MGWTFKAHLPDGSTRNESIRANAYADDIKTASETIADLQRIHDIVQIFIEDVLDIPLNFGKTIFLAATGGSREQPPPELDPDKLFETNRSDGNLNQKSVEGQWSSAAAAAPPTRQTPADAILRFRPSINGVQHPDLLPKPQNEAIQYLGLPFRADLSYENAETLIRKAVSLHCNIARSIPRDRPWSFHELRLYLNEHVLSRIEHICAVYPISEALLRDLDNEIAGLVSYMSAMAKISAGDYKSDIVGTMLNMPRPSERAKISFVHHSLLMLEREDIHGTLARERLHLAQQSSLRRNIMSNRLIMMRRWAMECGFEIARNTPLEHADNTETSAVRIFDERTQSPADIGIGLLNTRPITDAPTDTGQPISITVAVDGSFRETHALEADNWKSTTVGRYGFVVLTPWLHAHWETLQHIKSDQELCCHLIQHQQSGDVFFRLSEMQTDTARSSLQPELWGAALLQTAIPTQHRVRVITDNMASLQAFTEAGHRPNRNEGRVTHKLHMSMEDHFHRQRPTSQNRRADAIHQHSHTEERTLPAFLNRCIDILLNHAPPNQNTPQPNLTNMEHAEGYLLLRNGQHIIGDRRRTLQRERAKHLMQDCAQSGSQGQVWKLDPKQCQEVRNLAWKLGETQHFMPALLTAMWTESLLGFHSFSGAEITTCEHCDSPEGATAAHFLRGCNNENLRTKMLHPALIKAVRDQTSREGITDQDILTQLTTVPEAPPLPATMLETDPDAVVGHTPGGKPVVVCPKCRRKISFLERQGRINKHNCILFEEEEVKKDLPHPVASTPEEAEPADGNKSIRVCPRCWKDVRFSARLGRLVIHSCVASGDNNMEETQENQNPAVITVEGKTQHSKKRQLRDQPRRDPIKQNCPDCDSYCSVNKNGSLHRHNCDRSAKKKQRPEAPANSILPPTPPPDSEQEPKPIPPYRFWRHRRTQNAYTIAILTGILTTAAITFLQFCIPDPLARAKAIKGIRTAWLDYAYNAWQQHRKARDLAALNTHVRKRKSYRRNPGKDPSTPRASRHRASDDSTSQGPSLMHHQSGEDSSQEQPVQAPTQNQDQVQEPRIQDQDQIQVQFQVQVQVQDQDQDQVQDLALS